MGGLGSILAVAVVKISGPPSRLWLRVTAPRLGFLVFSGEEFQRILSRGVATGQMGLIYYLGIFVLVSKVMPWWSPDF